MNIYYYMQGTILSIIGAFKLQWYIDLGKEDWTETLARVHIYRESWNLTVY